MAASTKYVQKYTRRHNHDKTRVKDEFFVKAADVTLLQQFRDKIEHMHQIQINYEEQTDEGQWLVLEGESEDRRNAKNYITAMCSPAERKQVQFQSSSCAELTDPATLELVEKKTNAFIRPLKKIAQFEISGTELAVTLALSEIEELVGAAVREGEEDQFYDAVDTQDEGVITISPNTHKASLRLSSVLQRALSANSDGVCSVDDYRNTTPAVQRVLVNCLQAADADDIDDDQLFADGHDDEVMKGSKIMMFYEDNGQDQAKEQMEVDREKTVEVSPGVSAFAEKMTELNISKPPVVPLVSKQHEYLHSFGLSVGFQEREVNEALQFVDEKTRPSDFLDLLNSLQKHDENDSGDDVVILETETVDLIDDKNVVGEVVNAKPSNVVSSQDNADATSVKPENKKQNNPSTLPDGYKERLLRDFITEDENCSVDELKRRNAERQKLLRQNFETKSQQDCHVKQLDSQGQTRKKTNPKGKNKRKKNKQQKPNTENQTDRSDLHEKQFRIDSDEHQNQTYSNDEDQTCVLRVWNKDQEQVEPGGAKSNEEPFQTTPKRKYSNNRNTQPQWHQPPSGIDNQRQNSPSRQMGGQWSHQQGPVGRGNFRKPTQVVTPVNAPQGGYKKTAPQERRGNIKAELRYIVIDGSNVAMTHGNGKFSCKGIKLCVDYFRQRGHDKITVFVPQWRQYKPSDDNPILDQNILYELKDEEILVFTPSRRIGRKLVAAYDDRFVLELAEAEDGIVVSNDQYRDLMTEKAAWRKLIEERLLMYSFVKDRFMPPNDPLGREGPCLDEFLTVTKQVPVNPRQRHNYQNQQQHYQQHYQQQQNQQHQQYQQQQQYHQQQQQYQQQQYQQHFPQASGHGHFHQGQGYTQQPHGHYQQGQSTFANVVIQGHHNFDNVQPPHKQGHVEKCKPQVQRHLEPHQFDDIDSSAAVTNQAKGHWKGSQKGQGSLRGKGYGVPRTDEETEELFKELRTIFPEDDQEEKVRNILANHERERDLTKLTNYLMSVLF